MSGIAWTCTTAASFCWFPVAPLYSLCFSFINSRSSTRIPELLLLLLGGEPSSASKSQSLSSKKLSRDENTPVRPVMSESMLLSSPSPDVVNMLSMASASVLEERVAGGTAGRSLAAGGSLRADARKGELPFGPFVLSRGPPSSCDCCCCCCGCCFCEYCP